LNITWNEARNEALSREIIDGHCGNVPEGLLPKLIAAQRARDATMADAMINHANSAVVAILGNGHARKDIGAPIYLAARMPTSSIVSIGLTEVDSNNDSIKNYLQSDVAQRYDYIWFTSSTSREDPCKGLRLPAATP